MELVYKEGSAFWVPAANRTNGNEINSYPKWEQVFRVFSDIYTRSHLDRAAELI